MVLADVVQHLAHGAEALALAQVQHQHVAAQVLHKAQQMRADDDGGAGGGAAAHGLLDHADALGVEPGQGFVEQQHLRIVDEGAGDRHLLTHSARQVVGKRVALLGEIERGEQGLRLGLEIRDLVGGGRERQVFPDGQGVEQARVVRDVAQGLLGGDRRPDDVVTGDRERSGRGRDDAGKAAQRGRLAGAIGPDQPQDLARADLEAQVLDGGEIAVGLAEIRDFDHGREHRHG